jgi:esterase/lipase superfamily enzyme
MVGLGAVSLSACAGPDVVLAPAQDGTGMPLFIGTTRVLDAVDSWPTQGVGSSLRRLEVSIAVPKSGVDAPRAPSSDEVARGPVRLLDDRRLFQRRLREDARRRGAHEALVFVHGYNNTIDSSVKRAVQVSRTFGSSAVPVHFAWASAGAPLAYVADRDAALLARDALQVLLEDIQKSGLKAVVLAHSMGALVTMEVLRQMAIGGHNLASTINGVFLVAPDIDVGLFRSQLDRMPVLPQPFVVLTNQRDRALALSRGLAGRRERLGSLGDPALLADFSITIIDATAITDRRDHFPVVNSPVVAGLFSDFAQVPGAFEDPADARDLLAGTVLGIRSLTQVVLSPTGL